MGNLLLTVAALLTFAAVLTVQGIRAHDPAPVVLACFLGLLAGWGLGLVVRGWRDR